MFCEELSSTMQTTNGTAAHALRPAGREDQKVELAFEEHEGVERVALRYFTWTDGLGWCCQKTIRLDGEQLEDLQRAVTVARHRLNRRKAEEGRPVQSAQVIQLPTLA